LRHALRMAGKIEQRLFMHVDAHGVITRKEILWQEL
jgi:hypothetical protein